MKYLYRTWYNGGREFSPVIEISEEDLAKDDTQSWITMRVFDTQEEAEKSLQEEREFYESELDAQLSAWECRGEE